jgi:DNA-binding transcriptional LysR family regulator
MDIKRLSHFIALVEEGRFAPAAQRMHLSAAAFSRSIQTLEAKFGMTLFDRTPQGVALTRAGQLLLPRARQMVFDSRCLEHEVGLLRTGDGGELGIGAAPVPAATVLPELLTRLRGDSPKLVTRVRFGNVGQLLVRLDAQEIDFCMGDPRLIDDPQRHETVLLGRHFGALFCRPDHPLTIGGVADRAALKRYGVATASLSGALQAVLARAYGFSSSRSFPLVVDCDDFNLLAQLVSHSDVIGLLPVSTAHADGPALCRLVFDGERPVQIDVHAIWLKGRTLSPAARRGVALAQRLAEPASARAVTARARRPRGARV